MNHESSSGSVGDMQVNVGLQFHSVIDYDRKAMRKVLREGAADVRKEARRIVSRRAISVAGDFPGMQTGALKRAIGIIGKGSKGGWIKVGVKKTKEMKAFYPAFLFYGSPKTGLAKRGNFMIAALNNRSEMIRSKSRAALKNSLVPR